MPAKIYRILYCCFLLFTFFLTLFTSFYFTTNHKTYAAKQEGFILTQSWQCLNAKRIDWHAAEITSKNINQFLPVGTDVYIVECLSTSSGNKCTTGEENPDKFIFGNTNNLDYLKNNQNYDRKEFTGSQPMKSSVEGKIGPVRWDSYVKNELDHTFFGVTFSPEITLEGSAPTLQLSTFYFANSSADCTSVRWDPYGRVFDSQSLEPIQGATVTLYKKEENNLIPFELIGLENPQTTPLNGVFNFVVPDGIYVLQPTFTSHSFPNKKSKLNINYTKAYSDIYRGEDIEQLGQIQHRDIPLDPMAAAYHAPAKIMDYSLILDKLNSKILISGSTSHPLSVVKAYNGSKFLKQVTSSKYSLFNLTLDSATIDATTDINLTIVKTDLTSAALIRRRSFLFPQAQAQEETIRLNPILNNLEGYAFDLNKKPLPYAKVAIYLESSDKVFASQVTDENGYFNFPSQWLPPLPYYLLIESESGEKNSLTTSQFASLNQDYARENTVNWGTYRVVPKTSDTFQTSPTIITEGNLTTFPTKTAQTDKDQQILTKQKTGSLLILFLVITLLFCLISFAVYLYKRKNTTSD